MHHVQQREKTGDDIAVDIELLLGVNEVRQCAGDDVQQLELLVAFTDAVTIRVFVIPLSDRCVAGKEQCAVREVGVHDRALLRAFDSLFKAVARA